MSARVCMCVCERETPGVPLLPLHQPGTATSVLPFRCFSLALASAPAERLRFLNFPSLPRSSSTPPLLLLPPQHCPPPLLIFPLSEPLPVRRYLVPETLFSCRRRTRRRRYPRQQLFVEGDYFSQKVALRGNRPGPLIPQLDVLSAAPHSSRGGGGRRRRSGGDM